MTWLPLTPSRRSEWQRDNRTIWFRDSSGQIGFGTYELIKEMKIRVVEFREVENG